MNKHSHSQNDELQALFREWGAFIKMRDSFAQGTPARKRYDHLYLKIWPLLLSCTCYTPDGDISDRIEQARRAIQAVMPQEDMANEGMR